MYKDYMYTAGHVLLELCDQSDGNCTRQSFWNFTEKIGKLRSTYKKLRGIMSPQVQLKWLSSSVFAPFWLS